LGVSSPLGGSGRIYRAAEICVLKLLEIEIRAINSALARSDFRIAGSPVQNGKKVEYAWIICIYLVGNYGEFFLFESAVTL
jgi:hypothetical protein